MTENTKDFENAKTGGSAIPPEKVKVYEEKKSSTPIWMWLLPLLLLLGIGAWLLSRNNTPAASTTTAAQSLGYVNFDTDSNNHLRVASHAEPRGRLDAAEFRHAPSCERVH